MSLKPLKDAKPSMRLLHHTLKTVTLLFNPVTPYLSEALYQKIYRQLEPELARID